MKSREEIETVVRLLERGIALGRDRFNAEVLKELAGAKEALDQVLFGLSAKRLQETTYGWGDLAPEEEGYDPFSGGAWRALGWATGELVDPPIEASDVGEEDRGK
jgi:hypothetical protein